jgi:hypothetical protein
MGVEVPGMNDDQRRKLLPDSGWNSRYPWEYRFNDEVVRDDGI